MTVQVHLSDSPANSRDQAELNWLPQFSLPFVEMGAYKEG